MLRSLLTVLRRRTRHTLPARFLPWFEALESRLTPALTATFSAQAGVLTVTGDEAGNAVIVGRDPAGTLTINAGLVAIQGGSATVVNTTLIRVLTGGGNDRVELFEANGELPRAELRGGAGDDTLLGGAAADFLFGGGDDLVEGNGGQDRAFLGAGNDVFGWDPGDDNDQVDGQAGSDILVFNGSAALEAVDLSAGGNRLRLFRNVDDATLSVGTVERVDVNALGGADLVTVNNLAGTGVKRVNVTLGGPGTAGDAQPDTVVVRGTAGDDAVKVAGVPGGSVSVTGLAVRVDVFGSEADRDVLLVETRAGNDAVDASGLAAGAVKLTLDAGAGNDTVTGSAGNDTLLGAGGNDRVRGGAGRDLAWLGAGNDVFAWKAGDGADTVEGEDGSDVLRVGGSDARENIHLADIGSRLAVVRNAPEEDLVILDVDDVEGVVVRPGAGVDIVTVEDLSTTDVRRVTLNLTDPGSELDDASFFGSDGVVDDRVHVTAGADGIHVGGLSTLVTLTGTDSVDQLLIFPGAGNDVVDGSKLRPGRVRFIASGGAGNDTLVGSAGNDILDGDEGNDTLFGGAGDDFLDGGADTDELNGGAGTDKGANGEVQAGIEK